MSEPIPGWYPDPEEPTRQRFWDGTQWTEARAYPAAAVGADGTAPAAESAEAQAASRWRLVALLGLLAALLLAAAYFFLLRDTSQTPEPLPVPDRRVHGSHCCPDRRSHEGPHEGSHPGADCACGDAHRSAVPVGLPA